MKTELIFAGMALTMISISGVKAQTILNGSFEEHSASDLTSGGLYEWNHTGNVVADQTYSGLGNISLSTPILPYAGGSFAVLTPQGDGDATLSQTVASATGNDFSVSFALDLALYFNGKTGSTGLSADDVFTVVDTTDAQTLYTVPLNSLFTAPTTGPAVSSSSGWEYETSPEIGGLTAGDNIQFEFLLDSEDFTYYAAALAVDDVSLTAGNDPVPDGGFTWSLLGLSAGLLSVARRFFVR